MNYCTNRFIFFINLNVRFRYIFLKTEKIIIGASHQHFIVTITIASIIENAGAAVEEEERARPAPQRRPEGMPRNAVRRRPTRGVRDRIQAAARQDDSGKTYPWCGRSHDIR